MTAPTTGWLTIGINEKDQISGAYLLMGRVVFKTAELVEHVTLSPGNYKPITSLGEKQLVKDISGTELSSTTSIAFSLPVTSTMKYHKNLSKGKTLFHDSCLQPG